MTHDERVAKINEYIEDIAFLHMTETTTDFSTARCDTCGTNKAGQRYEWKGHIEEGPWQEWIALEVCTPCTFEMMYPGEQDASD